MAILPAGPVGLPHVALETWLIKFDKDGACMSPQTRSALLSRIAQEPKVPLILFSHGWNNEYEDASSLYSAFLKELGSHYETYQPGQRRPLFVGVIWPSTWLSFDKGPALAATGGATEVPAEEELKHQLAAELPDHAGRERFYHLLNEERLASADVADLASLLSTALRSGLGGGGADGLEASAPDADAVLSGLEALHELESPSDDELPEGGTIDGSTGGIPQGAGLLRYLDPRWALRLASVYQMKDRAGTVGWHGVSALLRDMLAASEAPLHAVGHSYGAKVVLSAIAGNDLPRPVESVLLLQPAISYLCFAKQLPGQDTGGGYRDVPAKVRTPILATYSAFDVPLHTVFHRILVRSSDPGELHIAGAATAAGPPPNIFAALGGFGPRDAGEALVEPLPAPGDALKMPTDAAMVGFDGTKERRITGHGNVATRYTTWLLYCQLAR